RKDLPRLESGRDEETLILYFGGYGATIPAVAGGEVRCVLPFDADSEDLKNTCISTTELDQLLDSWQRVLVIFDTSYDGTSGFRRAPDETDASLFSRTLIDYFARDPGWRLSSGTDRDNRVFLVASGTNTPSYESAVLRHGVFT